MKNKMTMLILSCDKFSDLWDGHVKLLEQNWPDRNLETYIVTDSPTNKTYPHVKIISAGKECEWSDRLAYALKQVKTDFVFITLDDYFLIKPVQQQAIVSLLEMMEKEKIDYVRLFKHPKRATRQELAGYPGIHHIDTSYVYSVNLYTGIWRTDFLKYTVEEPKSAWSFEVSLAKKAQKYNANCVMSKNNEFLILDVVRKGKILHAANRYFKKHPDVYNGNRPIQTWNYEIKLAIQTGMARILPLWMHKPVKKILNLFGKHFYSDEAE